MTTTTSFSKDGRFLSMYRFTLRQNAGYLGLATLLIFLVYPLQYLMEVFKKIDPSMAQDLPAISPYAAYNLYGLGRNFSSVAMVLFTIVFLLLPFVLSLMLNSYMHSKKAADVYHSLPVRRETLITVNTAVAMTILTVPLVLSNVIVLVASLVKFGKNAQVGFHLLDMCCWLVAAFLIYVITTFVSTQTGTVFDTFLFSGVLLFILPAGLLIFILLNESFLFGYHVSSESMLLALRLSPILFPMERMAFYYDSFRFGNQYFSGEVYDHEKAVFEKSFAASNCAALIYLLVAVLLLFLTMRLYSKRHSEQAEMATSRCPLATAVEVAISLLGGIFTGILFYNMVGPRDSASTSIIWTIIGSLVIFVVMEVILNRGFKTLRRRAPLGGIVTVASLACVVITSTGGLGYETRIPDPEKVDGVEISWDSSYYSLGNQVVRESWGDKTLTSTEAIRAVAEFQKAVVEERFDQHSEALIEQGKIPAYSSVTLEYDKTIPMHRNYYDISTDSLEKLIPLEVSEEFQQKYNPFFLLESEKIDHWTVSDAFGWNEREVRLSAGDNKKLLDAIRADYLERTGEEALHPEAPLVAHLTIAVPDPNPLNTPRAASFVWGESSASREKQGYITVYTPVFGKNTKAALQELSLLPPAPDISKCVGVQVQNGNRMMYRETVDDSGRTTMTGQLTIRDSLIEVATDSMSDGPGAFQAEQENLNRRLEDDFYRQMEFDAGEWVYFLDDPEEIAAFAGAIAPSWRADEPLARVNFFSDAGTYNRTVLVPLSKLPVSLQEKLNALPEH